MKIENEPDEAPASGTRWSEADRVAALKSYAILDTPRETEFDDVVRLAAETFAAPIAVVNLVSDDRQWFKAEIGIGTRELPLDVSICAHAILQNDFLIVPDTRADPRFDGNPLVTASEGLRFYAGAILRSAEGLPIGTVCVLDREPRPGGITPHQHLVLEVLARQVMTQLELRKALVEQQLRAEELRGEVRQRANAEIALRGVEERYRLVSRATNDAIWDWDFATNHVIWNEALAAAHGHKPDRVESTGDWWIAQIHPDDRERVEPPFETPHFEGINIAVQFELAGHHACPVPAAFFIEASGSVIADGARQPNRSVASAAEASESIGHEMRGGARTARCGGNIKLIEPVPFDQMEAQWLVRLADDPQVRTSRDKPTMKTCNRSVPCQFGRQDISMGIKPPVEPEARQGVDIFGLCIAQFERRPGLIHFTEPALGWGALHRAHRCHRGA